MDGVRDIGGTDKLHAGIIGGAQVCKAVLWYDSALKADTLRFPQTLLQIRHAAYLAAEADFTDGDELIAHGAVQKRRHHAQTDGKVAGGIPQGDAADDVDIH